MNFEGITKLNFVGENLTWSCIPYSGFILREKIFANGWHLCILRIKFSRIAITLATPPIAHAAWDPEDPISMQYSRIIF